MDFKTGGWLSRFVGGGIKGSITHDKTENHSKDTHYQKSNNAKYTVDVHAGQLPMPEGVGIIIKAFSNAVEPIKMSEPNSGGGQQQQQQQ
jgi:hypothetical protein